MNLIKAGNDEFSGLNDSFSNAEEIQMLPLDGTFIFEPFLKVTAPDENFLSLLLGIYVTQE